MRAGRCNGRETSWEGMSLLNVSKCPLPCWTLMSARFPNPIPWRIVVTRAVCASIPLDRMSASVHPMRAAAPPCQRSLWRHSNTGINCMSNLNPDLHGNWPSPPPRKHPVRDWYPPMDAATKVANPKRDNIAVVRSNAPSIHVPLAVEDVHPMLNAKDRFLLSLIPIIPAFVLVDTWGTDVHVCREWMSNRNRK